MKRSFLIIALILFTSIPSLVNAQTNSDTINIISPKYVYCELVGISKFLSTKVTVSVDYGEDRSYFQDNRIKDEQTGKVATFNSMVDALNYMASKGWEFVQAYVVTTGNQNVYRWLLKNKKSNKVY